MPVGARGIRRLPFTEEDIPAHVEARIAEVRDFFRVQFNDGARRVEQHAREHCEMLPAALREEAHHELISVEGSSAYRQARVQEELVRARHGKEQSAGLWRIEMANDHAQAAGAGGCGGPSSVLGGSGTGQRPCSY